MKGQLFAMGLDKRDVEEIVLDSMAFFIEKVKADEYSDQGIDPIHYLSRVAKNKAYLYLRKKGPELKQLPDELVAIEGSVNEFDDLELLETGLQMIEERHRRLIELTYIEGYSDREIDDQKLSEFNGVNSIKSQRYKALQNLRKAILTISSE